jgi:hypothetical protein
LLQPPPVERHSPDTPRRVNDFGAAGKPVTEHDGAHSVEPVNSELVARTIFWDFDGTLDLSHWRLEILVAVLGD